MTEPTVPPRTTFWRRHGLRLAILLILLGAFFWYAPQHFDWTKLKASLLQANLLWALAGVAIMFASHLARAVRWRYLIPDGESVSLLTAFKATLIGYMTSNLITRTGELVRPLVLARRENRTYASILASIAVERTLDSLTLGVILCAILLTLRDRFATFFPDETPAELSRKIFVPLLAILVVLFIIVKTELGRRIVAWIERKLPERFNGSLTGLLESFRGGVARLGARKGTLVTIWTVVIWAGYLLSIYTGFLAFGLERTYGLGLSEALPVLAVTALATAIAPTPGGLGFYHAAAVAVMSALFGVSQETALAFATLTHGASYVAVTVVGLALALREGISLADAMAPPAAP